MHTLLRCVVSLTLVGSSIAVTAAAQAQDSQPTSAPTADMPAAATLMVGRWSLDMAAGMAASDTIPEEDRARRIEGVTGIDMTMLLTEDGHYETSMVMGGTTYQRPGQWTIDSQTDTTVRLAFVADDNGDADREPSYVTLTFDSPDLGTCVMESDGYPIPMQRMAE